MGILSSWHVFWSLLVVKADTTSGIVTSRIIMYLWRSRPEFDRRSGLCSSILVSPSPGIVDTSVA